MGDLKGRDRMTLTGSNLVSERIRHLDLERKGLNSAVKVATKSGVSEWYMEEMRGRIGMIGEQLIDLKKDLKRLQGT